MWFHVCTWCRNKYMVFDKPQVFMSAGINTQSFQQCVCTPLHVFPHRQTTYLSNVFLLPGQRSLLTRERKIMDQSQFNCLSQQLVIQHGSIFNLKRASFNKCNHDYSLQCKIYIKLTFMYSVILQSWPTISFNILLLS